MFSSTAKPIEVGAAACFTQHLVRTAVEIATGAPYQVRAFSCRQELIKKATTDEHSRMKVFDVEMLVDIANSFARRNHRVLCRSKLVLECPKEGWREYTGEPKFLTIDEEHYILTVSTHAVFPIITVRSPHGAEHWSGTCLADRRKV